MIVKGGGNRHLADATRKQWPQRGVLSYPREKRHDSPKSQIKQGENEINPYTQI